MKPLHIKTFAWAAGVGGLLFSWWSFAGPITPPGEAKSPGGFSSCSSFTRDGRHVCSHLSVPHEAQEHSRRHMTERAARRHQLHQRQSQAGAGLEKQLREQVQNAGGVSGSTAFVLTDSRDLSKIPQDPLNPLTPEKVALGGLLFHETAIALNPLVPSNKGTYSCASCHNADAGFGPGLIQGLGEGGSGFGPQGRLRQLAANMRSDVDVQPISTPAALNTAWQSVMLHNGQFGATGLNRGTEYAWTEGTPKAVNRLGYEGVETQAIAGLAVHRLVDDKFPQKTSTSILGDDARYIELFARAFPARPKQDRVNQETAGLAIAAYERTLIANRAPFQNWLRGDSQALTDNQKIGASVFFGAGRCVQCHSGPSLAGMKFAALGLNDLDTAPGAIIKEPNFQEVLGRGSFTGLESDMFTFKVPQLYNLKDHAAYGHGSSLNSIRAVLDYKNRARPENPRVPEKALAAEFQPLGLNESQLSSLADFLENGLYDPDLQRYLPSALPSGQCFPDNDPVARQDSASYCAGSDGSKVSYRVDAQ